MSYLVICPTCDVKMSVNAKTCPHCGETKFSETKRTSSVIKKCGRCNGRGSETPLSDAEKSRYGWGSHAQMPCRECKGDKEIQSNLFTTIDLRRKA